MEEKEIKDVEYIDYEKLKNEALNYLKKIGGEKWNYYDEHDPGITILENLCFAIMDLDYRINFPIVLRIPLSLNFRFTDKGVSFLTTHNLRPITKIPAMEFTSTKAYKP